MLDGLHFEVNEGEIVGVAGVSGNGQKELAEVLTGLRVWKQGDVHFDGKAMRNGSVRAAIELGIGHVPENRMQQRSCGEPRLCR